MLENSFLFNLNRSAELIEKLRESFYKKTHVDFTYYDLDNWDRNNLLYQQEKLEKGSHRKFNYIQYVWLKMVQDLLNYGFTYQEIRTYKEELEESFPNQQMYDGAMQRIDHRLNKWC